MSATAYQEPYRLPAGILAVAVHGAFFALLYFGFTWQTQPAATMSVELWRSLPEVAVAPPVQHRVEEVVQPVQPEEVVKPDIALPEKKKMQVKPVEKKLPPPKPIEKKPLPAKPAETKAVAPKPVESKQVEQKPVEPQPDAAEQQAARERAAQAAAVGRVVDEYNARIQNKIRSNIVEPPGVVKDARAEFAVTLLPGGSVLNAKLVKPSGNAAYDSAVERAIIKSQPLPLPPDMTLFNRFRELKLGFRPAE